MCINMYVYIYIYTHTLTYTYIYVRIKNMYTHICMYASGMYIRTHTHTHMWRYDYINSFNLFHQNTREMKGSTFRLLLNL